MCVCMCVSSWHLQRSNRKAAHVVPEDQNALGPSGGNDRALEIGGIAIAPV